MRLCLTIFLEFSARILVLLVAPCQQEVILRLRAHADGHEVLLAGRLECLHHLGELLLFLLLISVGEEAILLGQDDAD